MSEIKIDGKPLLQVLKGFKEYFTYHFPVDQQNQFLLDLAVDVKEQSARNLCIKMYKLYTELLVKANQIVLCMERATVFEDKITLVVDIGDKPVGYIVANSCATKDELQRLALNLEQVKEKLIGKEVERVEIYGQSLVKIILKEVEKSGTETF